MNPSRIRLAALCMAIAAPFAASAGDPCPVPQAYCPVNEYGAKSHGCPNSMVCLKSYEAPPAELYCTYDGYAGYNCQAWWQGEDLSYTFQSTSGSVSNPGPTLYPTTYVGCPPSGGLVLSVTVTSPFGLSNSTWVSLSCRNLQEH